MRAFLLAIVVFLIVAAGGASAVWYTQATQAKKSFETAIAVMNAKETHITYEAIQTSGFPLNVSVSIVKPHFMGRVDELLKGFVEALPEGPMKKEYQRSASTMPVWTEDMSLDGSIDYSINALSDLYTMTISGNWLHTGAIGQVPVALVSQSSGATFCSLRLEREAGLFKTLWNFQTLSRDGQAFMHDFRMLDCTFPPVSTQDSASKQVVMSGSGGRVYITSAPQGAQQQVRFYMKSTDAQVTPAGDALIGTYIKAVTPDSTFPHKFSLYGKQNIEVDFSYAAPMDITAASLAQAPIDINLSKLVMTSDVSNSEMSFHLANSLNGDSRMSTINLKSVGSVTDKYDALLEETLHGLVTQLYQPNATKPEPAIQLILEKYKPDELFAVIKPVIPNLHSLGTINQTLNASYQGNAAFTAGDISLSELQLSATPYGITGNGTAKLATGQMLPVANLTLNCNNCVQLIDDAVSYGSRIEAMLATIYNQPAGSGIMDADLAAGVKGFMAALSEPAKDGNKTNFSYTIVSNASGISISGKPLPDIMGLYNQYMAPVMQKHAAPAAPESAPAPAATE